MVRTREDDSLKLMKDSVERSIIINATPEEVFEVATGFEEYPKWAGVRTTKVLSREHKGLGKLVYMTIKMFGHHLTYTLQYTHDAPKKMMWHAVSGTIKALVGTYDFVPMGPTQTKVVYKLSVDPGFFVPGPVRKATAKMVAWCALKGLKKYTELPATKARFAQHHKSGGGGFSWPHPPASWPHLPWGGAPVAPVEVVVKKKSLWQRMMCCFE
mmetsp:Transcript_14433/g.28505  ORF Transcript_14433/g.28505 Transcript_14433/m.28505 type:complete len:213 (-) Transcript_14433:42-680(-)